MPGGETEHPQLSSAIVFKTALGAQAVAIGDIVYCIAAGKNALLHRANEEKPIPVFHSLSDIAKRLEAYPQFVFCHRSTLLNVAHCKAWRHALKEAIALVTLGGARVEEFIVSRTRKKIFLQRWEEYFAQKRPQR